MGNLFDSDWVAERYAEGRPDVHGKIAEHLRSALSGDPPVPAAVDLACGTGLSAVALTGLAEHVVATDISPAMIQVAARHPAVRYAVASAESLPFREASFDLAALGCAFHWCDPDALFGEAARVLRPDAPFIIYDNGFFGEMQETEEARRWFASVYSRRFPAPPRRAAFRPEMTPEPFEHQRTDFLDEWIPFTYTGLVRYLTTQTNLISVVESGGDSVERLETFLLRELEPFFRSCTDGVGHFRFGGLVSVLRRRAPVREG